MNINPTNYQAFSGIYKLVFDDEKAANDYSVSVDAEMKGNEDGFSKSSFKMCDVVPCHKANEQLLINGDDRVAFLNLSRNIKNRSHNTGINIINSFEKYAKVIDCTSRIPLNECSKWLNINKSEKH